MAFSLVWLPEVLKSAGLKVATVAGWEERGARDMGPIVGVICHHTAGSRSGHMPTLDILKNGRAAERDVTALPGPLCQLGLGRDGTYYVVAAGRANHAGSGIWRGATNGNSNFIGIEAENTGGANDFPWPAVQIDAYHRGVAAILAHAGRSSVDCCGHREYALPAGRKTDPPFDMLAFRASVQAIMSGSAPPISLIPAAELLGAARPTLRRGAHGEFVKELQTKLGLTADGTFGPGTEAAVRTFQRLKNMVPDGIIGPKSWAIVDTL